MINFNPAIHSALPKTAAGTVSGSGQQAAGSPFADTIKSTQDQLGKVDQLQKASDASIKDLLSGKNEDITSVVSTVAKADMSFKLLVGVRNKLVEAYKETMNMPI